MGQHDVITGGPAASADLAALGRGSGAVAAGVPRPASRWPSRVLVPGVILAAAAAVLGYAGRDMIVRPMDVRVVPVIARASDVAAPGSAGGGGEAGAAEAAPSGPLVQAPGWIEPDPFAVNVPALVDGIVREVTALEGDTVSAGQVVATIVDDELKLAERSARAMVGERRAEVARARAGLAPMRSAVAMAEAAADMVRDEINRKRGLVKSGGIPAAEFVKLEIQLRGDEARIEQARGELSSAEAAVGMAEAALGTAEAQLAEAQLRLSRTEVRAPTGGVVMARMAAPGTRIAMTAKGSESSDMSPTILKLYDPAHLRVRSDVPLSESARIGLGTPAEITTEALPNEVFKGRVSRVVHEANIQRNTVQFKVTIERPSDRLKPEMLVRVRFNPSGSGTGAAGHGGAQAGSGGDGSGLELLLPTAVLLRGEGGRARVWLARQADSSGVCRAELREVTAGAVRGEDTLIVAGVRPGDRAIVDPPAGLSEGARVRVTEDARAAETGRGSK